MTGMIEKGSEWQAVIVVVILIVVVIVIVVVVVKGITKVR